MAVLDDQGRLFGRINIIDAGVLATLCLLIPVAYGGFLMFRTPAARILAVEPSRAIQGVAQVRIRGEHLRPYLRATIGTKSAPLLFETPEAGALQLPLLEAGTYDVVLYDEARELGRLPGGLVIEPALLASSPGLATAIPISLSPAPGATSSAPPAAVETVSERLGNLVVVGAFRGFDPANARAIAQNLRGLRQNGAAWGQVDGFQPPEPNFEFVRPDSVPVADGTFQVRAVLRLRCIYAQGDCRIQNVSVAPASILPIAISGVAVPFQVQEVHPAYNATSELVVNFGVLPEVGELLANPPRTTADNFPARDALRPALLSADVVKRPENSLAIATVRLKVPILMTPDGGVHRGQRIRVGGEFRFENSLYAIQGHIVGIRSVDEANAAPAQ